MELSQPEKLTVGRKRLIAYNRFGLGARPGTFGLKNPKKALLAELDAKNVARITDPGNLPTYAQACVIGEKGSGPLPNGTEVNVYDHVRVELDARYAKHMSAKIGFVERLVLFWANHFSMSIHKEVERVVMGTLGQLERDVIRRHVLGKFSDMLVGVMTHPAMITYLDNHISVGPNSTSVKDGNQYNDVNVNLAREIMELHTVGSGGGYTEADVKELALILSGWSYVTQSESQGYNGGNAGNVGQFIFKPGWHEPKATFTHMGVTRANEGKETGVKVLRWLAMRPATAEFLAYKMVKHFIADQPTKAMVDPVKAAYLKSGGNLKAMAKALVNLPAAWSWPLKKFRTPYETTVAQYRAMKTRHSNYVRLPNGSDGSNYQTTRWNLIFLNQPPWECLDPDGWDDDSAEWLNADSVRVRVAAAYESVTTYAPPSVKVSATTKIPLTSKSGVVALGKSVLGGGNLSTATVNAIKAAPDAKKALAVLFTSPEFQRR